jgi:hypothetical protein
MVEMKFSIRLLYLYLFSFIGLLVAVIGAVQLTDLAIKVYVFKGADRYDYAVPKQIAPDGKELTQTPDEIAEQKRVQDLETTRQRQRQASTAISMILIGVPLYLYHWKSIQKENKKFKS